MSVSSTMAERRPQIPGYGHSLRILFVLHLLTVFCGHPSQAYSGIIPPDPAAGSGKCMYRGDLLDLGSHNGPAPCQRLQCREDGSILVEGCGKLWLENCNRGERKHYNKPYPECCKLIYKCKKADGSSYYVEKDSYLSENFT